MTSLVFTLHIFNFLFLYISIPVHLRISVGNLHLLTLRSREPDVVRPTVSVDTDRAEKCCNKRDSCVFYFWKRRRRTTWACNKVLILLHSNQGIWNSKNIISHQILLI
jgi:hypothetical protein